MSFKTIILILVTIYLSFSTLVAQENLKKWTKGFFDIHHINTASGDATFFIFPDGTTMLFDLGAKNAPKNNPEYFHLKTNKNYSPAQIVTKYIQAVHPSGKNSILDYAVISHFHKDHYGKVDESSLKSSYGDYLLSGITEINEYIPILNLIDRAYPSYNIPKGLKEYYKNDKTFTNYMKFVDTRDQQQAITEQLVPGSKTQLSVSNPNLYPNFEVRNLKTNLSVWAGKEDSISTIAYDFLSLIESNSFNENPLSLALLIRYGDFNYFTGGDLTGYDWRNVLDIETPIADVIGEVDAVALNHHGFHDATNAYFMRTLHPKVVVNQSRHTPHFQFTPLEQVVKIDADFYVNNLHDETFNLFSKKLKGLVKGKNGHILIRVLPMGCEYYVYLIDDDDFDLKIINSQGPYISKK